MAVVDPITACVLWRMSVVVKGFVGKYGIPSVLFQSESHRYPTVPSIAMRSLSCLPVVRCPVVVLRRGG